MQSHWIVKGKPAAADIGHLLRVIYHYWYQHRRGDGHPPDAWTPHLPEFVGDIDAQALTGRNNRRLAIG